MSNITINKKKLCSRQKVVKKHTNYLGSKTLVLLYIDEKAIVVHSSMFLLVLKYFEYMIERFG